ncbi:hypothetical protein ABIE88_008559 [Bradyrhizobium diazoefficiens]
MFRAFGSVSLCSRSSGIRQGRVAGFLSSRQVQDEARDRVTQLLEFAYGVARRKGRTRLARGQSRRVRLRSDVNGGS